MSWLVPGRNKEIQTTLSSVFGSLVMKVMALNKGYEKLVQLQDWRVGGKRLLGFDEETSKNGPNFGKLEKLGSTFQRKIRLFILFSMGNFDHFVREMF